MSCDLSAALQEAVFARLAADAALQDVVGGAIHDEIPPGTPPGTFVVLGPEEVLDRSDKSGAGAEHRLRISVISSAQGFRAAKLAAGAISEALEGAPLALSRGRVVGLWFDRAVAAQGQGRARRIDITYRVRVEP